MSKKQTTLLALAGTALFIAFPFFAYAAQLPNPLPVNDPESLALQILKVFLGFLALIALIMFIYGGFMMLTSAGNADRIKKAKNTLVWAAAGVIIILGSYSFLRFVFTLFTGQ